MIRSEQFMGNPEMAQKEWDVGELSSRDTGIQGITGEQCPICLDACLYPWHDNALFVLPTSCIIQIWFVVTHKSWEAKRDK